MSGPAPPVELLAAIPATASLARGEFSVLHGGVSNHAWRCDAVDGAWFVRLAGAGGSHLGVDRAAECALLGATTAAGLAPALLYCDPGRGLLVTRFVEGGAWTREAARRPRNLQRVAGLLRRLHALPVPGGVCQRDFAATAAALRIAVGDDSARDSEARLCAEAGEKFRRLAACARGTVAPCHNDVHHLNLLDDGDRLWLVDWEYGGAGDPIYDLASLCCHHLLNDQERATLLNAYGERPGLDPERLAAACWTFDFVQWLWYRVAARRAEPSRRAEHVARAADLERRLSIRATADTAGRAERLLRCNN